MAKNKFYVVWKGLNPGIYDNWAECKAQVDGQEGAKYKSFENREEAAKAFEAGYTHYLKTASSPKAVARLAPEAPIGNPINESLAVDAACSGNPVDMEYIKEQWKTVFIWSILKKNYIKLRVQM